MASSRAEQPVGALVFDAYGTLFDIDSLVTVCDGLFPGQGQALSQLWRAKQLEYTWLLSLMRRYEDFWQLTERALTFACRALDLPCDGSGRARLMDCYLRLDTYPDVAPALSALSPYPLAILSNGSPRMLEALVQNAGLAGSFTQVMSVDEVQIYKPSPQAYALAAQRLGLNAASIGFVSSNSFDVAGAKSFGLWTCWLNRRHAPLDELGFAPDATIQKLTHLPALRSASAGAMG